MVGTWLRTAIVAVAVLGWHAGPAAAQPAASAPAAAPAHTVRVGIVVELIVNVTPERADQLGAALADALHRELEVDAVGGGDVARRLPEGGVPEECLADRACYAGLARRLDASELLFLAVVQVGADIQIDASWVDVASGEVVSRPRIELLSDARAGEVFSAAATRLLPHARKRPLAVLLQPGDDRPAGPQRHLTAATWIAAGTGVALLAGGTALGLSARSSFNRCEGRPDDCDQDTRDGIGRRALYADLLLGGAIVGVATAVVLYARSDRGATAAEPPASPAATTAWSVTPTRGGAFAELRVGF